MGIVVALCLLINNSCASRTICGHSLKLLWPDTYVLFQPKMAEPLTLMAC